MNLNGKVALITGGGRGIGSAIAKRFVADGARVCITGRSQAKLDNVAGRLPAGSATTCAGDVSKYEDAGRMVETTVSFGGKIDVLVNNAGIDPGGSVVDLDPGVWREVIETNLTGPFLLMKAAIPRMIGNEGFGRQYSLPRRLALPPGNAGLCVVKSGPDHAHPAGRAGLRPLPYQEQCRLSGRHQDEHGRTFARRPERNAQHRSGGRIQGRIVRHAPAQVCSTGRDRGHLQLPRKR